MEEDNLWAELTRTITWGGLLTEYLDALQHIERYKAAHPELELPASVMTALQHMVTLYAAVRHIAENPARHGEPATEEAVNVILRTVAKVRRDVPTVEQFGHA